MSWLATAGAPLGWEMAVVSGWALAALICAWRSRRGARLRWLLAGTLCAGLAGIRGWRWDLALWRQGRRWLHEAGIYAERARWKLGLAILLSLCAILALLAARRGLRAAPWTERIAWLATGLALAFHASIASSLIDAYLPAALLRGSSRAALEVGLCATALLAFTLGARAR